MLGGGVAIGPFVVGDIVASGIGSLVCMPERSGELCLPMKRSAACRNGVVVQLLEGLSVTMRKVGGGGQRGLDSCLFDGGRW